MQVEIWSDIMCPFCYIGKRKFETALQQFDHAEEVQLVWKSFQLDPTLKTDPDKSVLQQLAEHKHIPEEEAATLLRQVTAMAQSEGLTFRFDRSVVANSFDAHRLIQLAKHHGRGDAAEERLFRAYFTEGANIADRSTLVKLGEAIGLSAHEIEDVLDNGTYRQEVQRDIQEAQQLGVRGVPFFVINRRYGISGAQPAKVFLKALTQAHQERAEASATSEGDACEVNGNC